MLVRFKSEILRANCVSAPLFHHAPLQNITCSNLHSVFPLLSSVMVSQ